MGVPAVVISLYRQLCESQQRMRTKLLPIIVLFAATSCGIAVAQQSCTDADEGKAERQSSIQTWSAFYQFYDRYARCDDAAVGEAFDDSVSRLLLEHWVSLPDLAALVRKDTQFKAFVLRHVSPTAFDTPRLTELRANADMHCPAGNDSCARNWFVRSKNCPVIDVISPLHN